MPTRPPVSPDPLIETPAPDVPAMDYPSHVRTFNRFVNIVKWFAVHVLIMLVALYFFIIAHNSIVGLVFLLIAVGLLLYGLLHNPSIRHDIEDAAAGTPAE